MARELSRESDPDDDPERRDALTTGIAAADAGSAALDDAETWACAVEFVEAGIRLGRRLRERGLSVDQAAGTMGGTFATALMEAMRGE